MINIIYIKNKQLSAFINIMFFVISLVLVITFYYDIFNPPNNTIEQLVGKNYEFAYKVYFKSEPDIKYIININQNHTDLDESIKKNKIILIDSIISVYTWNYSDHKKIIWTGKTKKMENQILDAKSIEIKMRL